MVIYDPRHPVSGQGKLSNAVVGNIDMAPTILYAMGCHLAEPRSNLLEDTTLRRDDTHETNHVAWVVQCDWEIVTALVELDLAREDDLLEMGHGALARDVQLAGEDAVGDDRERLVGMPALTEHHLLDLELGRLVTAHELEWVRREGKVEPDAN